MITNGRFKKHIALLLILCLLFISGCSRKSDNVRTVESLIKTIGAVELSNEERIQYAGKKYNALSAEEKEQVENAAVLISALEQLEKLKLDETTGVYLDIIGRDRIDGREAYKMIKDRYIGDDETLREFVQTLSAMSQCGGVFNQKDGYGDYYAEIGFYLRYGQYCCAVKYTGFRGSLEDGTVRLSRDGDYLLEGEAVGYALYEEDNTQKLQMRFGPAKLRIWWGTPDENGNYYSDYYLTKGEAA